MVTRENVALGTLTTMQLGGLARYVVEITTHNELVEAITFARGKNLPFFVLGGGSNVIASDEDFDGVIILNLIKGFEKLAEDDMSAAYRIGAGEIWDEVVARLCDLGLSGIEALSAIPGTAGATPVQNVGAYGQEIADTLVELEAYDVDLGQFVTLSRDDCRFTYRNSVFKDPQTRHHVIVSITLSLRKKSLKPPFYPALQKYLDENEISDFSPQSIRAAVIAVRADKLPDPRRIANTGSFFRNPIVNRTTADKLLTDFPNMPHWPTNDGQVKLAAGWLIDQADLKSFSKYGLQLYPKNALVVTNIAHATAKDLTKFKEEIIAKVQEKFGVELEQEPENLT